MNITINDKVFSIPESNPTIMAALKEAGIEPQGIAVAVNSTVVAREHLASHALSEGDSLIIIKAFYGG